MDSNALKIINEILGSKKWIRLTEEISVKPDFPNPKGKFEIDSSKGLLCIDVIFSNDFPLGAVSFFCTNVKGYQHQMQNGGLCLNASPAKSIQDRLEFELEKLEKWVDRYYINEILDDHFEYYQFQNAEPIPIIFEEDENKKALKGDYGKFSYMTLNERALDDFKIKTFVAADLGGRKCRWSNSFLNSLSNSFTGIWIYIKNPPVIQRRQTIVDWKDLLILMTNRQTAYLYKEYQLIKKHSFSQFAFFVLLGYDIPSEDGSEIHWEAVAVQFEKFPYIPEKIGNGNYQPKDLGYKVQWCISSNASYKRMFGRGKLADKLTNSKILVIGTGAIGSSLFMSLVRGGAKFVDINDGDSVEPGNICRSEFAFRSSYFQKVKELEFEALATSPFLEMSVGKKIEPITKDNMAYNNIKSQFMEYDYIFDCSTDKYLSIMIDEMQLKGTVINLSISNEAENLVVVIGTGNIHLIKNIVYNKLPNSDELFHVATGCWHPTFKASYSDINVLLHYAINEMNNKINNGTSLKSFMITKELKNTNLQYSINYNV